MKTLLWNLWGLIVVIALCALVLWTGLVGAAPSPEKCSVKVSAMANRLPPPGGVLKLPRRCTALYIAKQPVSPGPMTSSDGETATGRVRVTVLDKRAKCRPPEETLSVWDGKSRRGYVKLYKE